MQQYGIEFTSSSFTLSVLKISGDDLSSIEQALINHTQKAPSLFENMSLVLDVSALSNQVALADVVALAKQHKLRPMGVRHAQAEHKIQAQALALPQLNSPKANASTGAATKVVHRSVRSGQQIYAQGGDLVILGSVSNGAEVIADGSIHILGTLRGRAIAGAQGQTDASVLVKDQQAEMISIGGYFWLSDAINQEYWQQSLLITQKEGQLQFQSISI